MEQLLLAGLLVINQILSAGNAVTAFSLLLYALTFNPRERTARILAFLLGCVSVTYFAEVLASTAALEAGRGVWLRLDGGRGRSPDRRRVLLRFCAVLPRQRGLHRPQLLEGLPALPHPGEPSPDGLPGVRGTGPLPGLFPLPDPGRRLGHPLPLVELFDPGSPQYAGGRPAGHDDLCGGLLRGELSGSGGQEPPLSVDPARTRGGLFRAGRGRGRARAAPAC